MNLPSTKPYLVRAIYEWCCDNGFTPYLAVAVDARTVVPREFVRDGQIVLNVSPDATNRLQIGNDLISFQARFGGVARDISVPLGNVTAIYARENGAGMAFELEEAAADAAADASEISGKSAGPVLAAVTPTPAPPAGPDGDPEQPPPAGRPRLQRIK